MEGRARARAISGTVAPLQLQCLRYILVLARAAPLDGSPAGHAAWPVSAPAGRLHGSAPAGRPLVAASRPASFSGTGHCAPRRPCMHGLRKGAWRMADGDGDEDTPHAPLPCLCLIAMMHAMHA